MVEPGGERQAVRRSGLEGRSGRGGVRGGTGWVAGLLALVLVSALQSGCRRYEAPAGTQPAGISAEERREYVASSVEVGCMALRETDPVRLAAFAHASFKRHHFENTMHLLDVVGTLEPDPEIRAAIGKGLTACR